MTEEQVSKLEDLKCEMEHLEGRANRIINYLVELHEDMETLAETINKLAVAVRDKKNEEVYKPVEEKLDSEELNPFDIKSVARAVYGREI